MSCLAEDRFVELLDGGGLDATRPEERVHLEACDACRESWATVAAAGEVLTAARPRSAFKDRLFPVLVAAAMLLTIIGVIAVRSIPAPVVKSPDPIALFLEGKPEARETLLRGGRKVLPALAAERPKFKAAGKLHQLLDLMFEIKFTAAKQDPEALAIFQKLDTMKVDLAFENTAVDDILNFVQDFTSLNAVLDPTIRAGTVDTLKVKDMSLRGGLTILCAVKDLDYDLRYGVLFFTTPVRLWSTEKGVGLPLENAWARQVLAGPDADVAAKLRDLRMTLDMQNAPLSAITGYVTEIGGLKVAAPPLIAETSITIRLKDVRLGRFLEILTLPRGWEVRIEDGSVKITADR